MKIDLIYILKKYLRKENKHYLIKVKSEHNSTILQLQRVTRHGLSNKSVLQNPTNPTKINKYVKVDNDFIKYLGLWFGDGFKRRVGISNNELTLVKFYLDSFEKYIGCSRGNFSLSIYTNREDVEKIKPKRTLRELDLPKSSFRNIYIDERCTRPIFYLNYSSVSLTLIIDAMFNYITPFLFSNKSFTVSFLKGVFAAEGSVKIGKHRRGTKRALTIAGNKDARAFYKRLLKRIDIKTICEDRYCLSISNQHDIIKLKKLHIASLHSIKNKKLKNLVAGYKEFHRRKREARKLVIKFLGDIGCVQTKEIANKLGYTPDSALAYLNRLKRHDVTKHLKVLGSWFWLLKDAEPKEAFRKRMRRKYHYVIEAFKKLNCTSPHGARKYLRENGVDVWNKIYYIVNQLVEAELLTLVKKEPVQKGAISIKRYYSASCDH